MNFLFPLCLVTMTTNLSAANQLIFIGTSTGPQSASLGIYAVRLDSTTGGLSKPILAAKTPNPGFLAWHPDGRVLYALGESAGPDGKSDGAVTAFAFNRETGSLSVVNTQTAGDAGTTHLAVDATGRLLITVSYHGDYVASFPLAADGRILPRASFISPQGPLGPNSSRQEKPHPHSVIISPDNRFAFVADLGLDRVLAYRLNLAAGTLEPNDPAYLATPPGSGPRHTKFSRDGRNLYILGEIDGSVTTCAYDAVRGTATPLQHISTLPAGFMVTDPDRAAEIRVHPNGRFVYASNRGHDSIAVFAVNADGTLKLVEITASGGGHPRNFELSPDGSWLVCANRDSNNLVVFKVDAATGRLTRTGATASVPAPICVLFGK